MKPKSLLVATFGTDLRSLALLRVSLALLILFDLGTRAMDMTAHYTDLGVLPRAPLIEKWTNVWHVSAHLMNGTWQFEAALFALAAAVAALLLIGWRTRLMTALSWALMLSLQARNPMVLQAGDVLFRMLLFWGMFLPLGARYSVDAALGVNERDVDNRHLSVASAAYLLQICFVYWFTVAQKNGHEWWPDGTAVYYALHIDTLATRYGIWLRQFGPLLKVLTYGSMAAELTLPVLLLAPLPWVRFGTVLALAGMHASFGVFLELGNFPWIDVVSLTALIPGAAWEWAGGKLRTPERVGLRIKAAGGLPEALARVLRSLCLLNEAQVEVIVAAPAAGPQWSLVTATGEELTGREAWIEAARLSPLAGPVAARVLRLGQRLPFVAQAAPRLVPVTVQLLSPRPLAVAASPFANVVAALMLGLVFWWNLTTIPGAHLGVPPAVGWVAHLLRLDQQWAMFAPFPVKDDGWFVADGVLRDKTPVDAMAPEELRPPTYVKPEVLSATFANQRWRKYMMNLWAAVNHEHRLYYARYLCRSWNELHEGGQQLEEFHLYYLRNDTLPDYQPRHAEKIELWHHYCLR